ncbi:hypothetical protein [Blastopirellula retiformator]|uniref:DUF4261 domain-containing protein n=1 Tax=Blastopirellula retiformator TaxID=2527970 RepID=A0A5C5V693_9BACT|nr:hypothetical protein [Blastopirellula retiformator]TWT33429.1 hypothetical protein Enr8_32600 [Blastopirellula retiformator]
MHETFPSPSIAFRIPGVWAHPGELIERLPEGFRLTPDSMFLPDGTSVEFIPMPPDDRFAQIFASSYRETPTAEEMETVSRYSVNVGLKGPGGSLEAAQKMMECATAIIDAGGAGVFIDNCALAHGGRDWIEMTAAGNSDALSFAYVSIIRGESEAHTMGMHALGYPDLQMSLSDINENGDEIIELLRYVCRGDKPIEVGHLIADLKGFRLQVVENTSDDFPPDSPMHNPFGRLRLVNLQDIADSN